MAKREKIAELIAYDIPKQQIAAALGLTEERLRQLIAHDDELQGLIQKKAAKIALQQLDRKVTETDVEQAILDRMHQIAYDSDSLNELGNALYRLRASEQRQQNRATETHINLQLGIIAQNAIKDIPIDRNQRSEIIAIDGREMATMPAQRVIELVKARRSEGGTSKKISEIPGEIVDAEDF